MPFFDRLLGAVATPPGDHDVPAGSIGYEGSSYFTEFLLDREQNPELVSRERYRLYDEMTADAKVALLLWAIKMPILGATWRCDPVDDSPQAKTVAEAVRWQFGLSRTERGYLVDGWPQALERSCMVFNYGSYTQEIIWGDEIEWTDSDQVVHLIRPIEDLEERLPHTIEKYLKRQPGQRDRLGGIRQEGHEEIIGGDKLLHHVVGAAMARQTGVSILRPCYTPWKLKKAAIVAGAISIDRYASPLPVVRYPVADSGAQARAEEIGRGIRVNERAYVAFPGAKPGPGQEGWDIELLSPDAGGAVDVWPSVQAYDEQILSSGLATFLTLNQSANGNRAMAGTMEGTFKDAVEGWGGMIAADWTDQAVARFVRANFADAEVPPITMDPISDEDVALAMRAIADAATAGVRFDDREAQNAIRQRLGLDPLEEDDALVREGSAPAGLGQFPVSRQQPPVVAPAGPDPAHPPPV